MLPLQGSGRGRMFGNLVSIGLALLVGIFVARYMVRHWQDVDGVGRLSAGWGALTLVFGVGGCLGFALVTRMVVAAHGHQVSLGDAVGFVYVPMLGKYVPGRIWAVLTGFGVYAARGIPRIVALRCMCVAIMISLSSGLITATLLGSEYLAGWTGWRVLICAVAASLVVIGSAQRFVRVAPGWLLTGRGNATFTMPHQWWLRTLGLNIVVWLVYGLGFYCIVAGLGRIPLRRAPAVAAVFIMAQLAGFAAFFAPAGIGVREGVFLIGLEPFVGRGNAISAAVVCRVWQTILELMMALVGWKALCGHAYCPGAGQCQHVDRPEDVRSPGAERGG